MTDQDVTSLRADVALVRAEAAGVRAEAASARAESSVVHSNLAEIRIDVAVIKVQLVNHVEHLQKDLTEVKRMVLSAQSTTTSRMGQMIVMLAGWLAVALQMLVSR